MATFYWTDHYNRRWTVCPCLQKWLPAYEAELLRRNLIVECIDLYQTIGNASASAKTHSTGGCADLKQRTRDHLWVARNMGAADWCRDADPNDGQPDFKPEHAHLSLKGCPHAHSSAKGQVVSCENGGNGLLGGGSDDGPRAGIHWPLRTWEQGIAWAKEQAMTKPSDILDLSRWKLQANGVDIKQPALDDYSTWRMGVSGTGVAFRARVSDNTTSGSSYPRSELREMKAGGKTNAAWSTTSGTHTLTATVAIGNLPKKRPIVVFGQVHDTSDDVVRLVGKRRSDNRIDLIASYGLGKGHGSSDKPIGTVSQGQRFTYRIRAKGGVVYVDINGVEKAKRAAAKTSCFYKVGVYVISNTDYDAATEYGGVVVYELEVDHE